MKDEIYKILCEEADRIGYGKIFIEATVLKGKVTNIQYETKRSQNVNDQ